MHEQIDFNIYKNHFKFKFPIKSYRIVDGDTIEVVLDLGFKISHEIDIRLIMVNTPESRGKESEAGKLVGEVVSKWFRDNLNSGIICIVNKLDKFSGRANGDFIAGDDSLVNYLMANGLAVKYDGNIRDDFDDEKLKVIIEAASKILN